MIKTDRFFARTHRLAQISTNVTIASSVITEYACGLMGPAHLIDPKNGDKIRLNRIREEFKTILERGKEAYSLLILLHKEEILFREFDPITKEKRNA